MAVDTTEIKKNSDWYYANLDSLLPKYDGKFIGISDCSVVGVFNALNSRATDCVEGLCASNTPPHQRMTVAM